MGDRKKIPLPRSPFELIIICTNTSHPGNLGAICRTMLNYGFDKLRLINPECSPDDVEARNRAKHAGVILDNVEIFDDFTCGLNVHIFAWGDENTNHRRCHHE